LHAGGGQCACRVGERPSAPAGISLSDEEYASQSSHRSELINAALAIVPLRRQLWKGFKMSSKIGQRINKWLDEPEGKTFKDGKWRWWFPMLVGFGLLNAVLTSMVFGSGGQLQTYIGAIMLSIGVLLAWC
jgi:hypothetical protein